MGIGSKQSRDHDEFRYVEPPLFGLVFGNERLRATKLFRQQGLRDAGLSSSRHEFSQSPVIEIGEKRAQGTLPVQKTGNPKKPKIGLSQNRIFRVA